jgi:hypothetical protein
MGDMFRPRLAHHQALVKNTDHKKLTHKMQHPTCDLMLRSCL